uniref:LysR family transcriptional regulator n=1 Tax=Castellaniella defragrans TaxID=75697 RepID=UPI0033420BF3
MNLLRTLSLRQLQSFTMTARHNSVARAAEALHVTQPAVSMQIRQLEEITGLRLFERSGRTLRLTASGRTMLHHAQRILGEIRDAEETLRAERDLDRGVILLGLVSTAAYVAPPLIARFLLRYPNIELRLEVGNREQLLRMLRENVIDLAIMGRPPAELDTLSEPLAAHPHVLAAQAGHRLAGCRRFGLHELRDETFLVRESGSGTLAVSEQFFKNHLFHPAKMLTLGSNETIKQAVMAGLGVSLLSLHALRLELRAGAIALLDVEGAPVDRVWHVVHRADKILSPAAQTFRRFLLDETAPFLAAEHGHGRFPLADAPGS